MYFVFYIVSLLFITAHAATWTQVKVKDAWYFDVSSAGNNKVYVLAGDQNGHPKIKGSTDGGNTFTDMPLNYQHPQIITAMEFNSKGSGTIGGMQFFKTALGYTSDFGKSWGASQMAKKIISEVNEIKPITGVENSFAAVGAYGKINGLAVSTDGGKSFKPMGYGINDITMLSRYGSYPSADTWYVSGGAMPQNDTQASSNYGASQYMDNIRSTVFEDFTAHVEMLQKVHDDLSEEEEELLGSTKTAGVIMKTTDAGQSWSQVLNEPKKYYVNQMSCVDDNTCWATVSGFGPETINGAQIINTVDGGKTWTVQKQVFAGVMYPLHMVSATEGWAGYGVATSPSSAMGYILHTTDGGKNWDIDTQIQNLVPFNFAFDGSDKAWLVCQPIQQGQAAGLLKYE